ncbi:MAG: SRPBCC family protein [Solirubrobacterales bacterium]
MVSCSRQQFIEAPVARVWELTSDPERQTEWWPDTQVFECEGERLETGCHVRSVASRPWPMGDLETTLEVGKLLPGKEVLIRCMDTGTYIRSVLTEAQGGTFIECEAGNDPKTLQMRVVDATVGKRLFSRWVDHALANIKSAAESTPARP